MTKRTVRSEMTILTQVTNNTYENVCDIVVALSSNRPNADSMATGAVHIRDRDVVPTCDRNAVILVENSRVGDDGIVAVAHVEAIRVVCGWKAVAAIVGRISGGVVEVNVAEDGIGGTSNAETVDGPILDV